MARADAYAAAAHEAVGQRRKYGGGPYIEHPRAVVALLRQVPHTDAVLAAALLHDTLEDTRVTYDDVLAEFGAEVAGLVLELTDQAPRSMGNRAVRKRWETERLSRASAAAQTIKLADLIHNTMSIVEHDRGFARVYLREKAALVAALERADPAMQALARDSLHRARQRLAAPR